MNEEAYGAPPTEEQLLRERLRAQAEAEELARIQRFSKGGSWVNPIGDYMNQGAQGKMGDATKEMLMGGVSTLGAGALAGVGGPLGILGSGAMGIKALGHVGQSIGDYHDAMRFRQGRNMWEDTGLPGRPPTMAEILMKGGQ